MIVLPIQWRDIFPQLEDGRALVLSSDASTHHKENQPLAAPNGFVATGILWVR